MGLHTEFTGKDFKEVMTKTIKEYNLSRIIGKCNTE